MIVHGLVKTEYEVLLENVTFYISELKPSGPELNEWSGYFTVPSEHVAKAVLIADSDGPFYLVLQDGRVGQFDGVMDMKGTEVIIRFEGNGALQKEERSKA